MKTIKLSLSALAALCYLVLFTACQDDTVSELEPVANDNLQEATKVDLAATNSRLEDVNSTVLLALNNLGLVYIEDITIDEAISRTWRVTNDQGILQVFRLVRADRITALDGLKMLAEPLDADNVIVVDSSGETVVIPVGDSSSGSGDLSEVDVAILVEAASNLGLVFIDEISIDEAIARTQDITSEEAVLNVLSQVETGELTVQEGLNTLAEPLDADNVIVVDSNGETVIIPVG